MSKYWTSFSLEQKLEIRNYVLNYLASRFVEEFVLTSLLKLMCRITKLGWFDGPEHRDIISDVTKFLDSGPDHHVIGLKLLNALIEEMNIQNSSKTLTQHRKTAVSFRDHALFAAFQLGINTLKQVMANSNNNSNNNNKYRNDGDLSLCALRLTSSCLSFDFIGTNPEESGEDIGTVQVPTAWRPVVSDTSTMKLFFDLYHSTSPPCSQLALKSLVQMTSVRRSLFASEKERSDFLNTLMAGIMNIMEYHGGLEEEDNYHEFCRLLGRLKTSYQLSELVRVPNIIPWLEKARDFTLQTMQNWAEKMNSIHYCLALWSRMVAALPYLRNDDRTPSSGIQAQTLKACVNTVMQAYIKAMLDSVQVVVAEQGQVDDPLDDEGSLNEALDRLPGIARLQYETVSQYLATNFNEMLSPYEAITRMSAQERAANAQQVQVVLGKLTWLVYIVAAILGTVVVGDPHKSMNELLADGALCRCVFQLLDLSGKHLSANGAEGGDSKLETALLQFLKAFKKSYMNDYVAVAQHNSAPNSTIVSPVPGGSPAHPLLKLALASAGLDRDDEEKDPSETTIFDAIGQGVDIAFIMSVMVEKLCLNIKYWHTDDDILTETLAVFVDFVSTYSSGKTLLGLDAVQFMVYNHTGNNFPFLGYDNDNKHRITFYAALARLVFASSEDVNNCFDAFVAPQVEICQQIMSMTDLRDKSTRTAIIGAFRDLKGICTSTYSRRTYVLLFDILFPAIFPMLNRVAETLYEDPAVVNVLLKFLKEFVQNKGQRIYFEQSSANGILLFREASSILCSYGSHILQIPTRENVYAEKYKGIRIMLDTITHILSGNYVNFGIFALYNDSALQNLLDVSLQLCLTIPLEDVLAYVKLSKSYFSFMEVLFRHHLDVLAGLDSPVFLELLNKTNEGLQQGDPNVVCVCAMAIDHVASYIFLNQNRGANKPTCLRIVQHVQTDPGLMSKIITSLFTALLFSSAAACWPLTRPILSVMLAAPEALGHYQEQLLSTQTAENVPKLQAEFDSLLRNAQHSLDTTQRDKFTSKLTIFRLNVRVFLNV